MKEKEIKTLVKKRLSILKKNYQTDVTEYDKKIINLLFDNFEKLGVDFIIETTTHLGYAPNLIYDDNGNFAITCDGYQPVVTGKEKIDGMVQIFVEKKQWKNTIRKAVLQYLTIIK